MSASQFADSVGRSWRDPQAKRLVDVHPPGPLRRPQADYPISDCKRDKADLRSARCHDSVDPVPDVPDSYQVSPNLRSANER